MTATTMNQSARRVSPKLLKELERILPPKRIIADERTLRAYECDGLMLYRDIPLAAVIPETVEQVQEVMRLSQRMNIPIVPRGAGTGLSAGAMPHPEGILLNMTAFDRILELDRASCIARVQPGVSNLSISAAAKRHGLFYAPDPSSQIICSIGGNVAENSGGVHCLKYGLTVHNVLQLTVVTPEGDLVTLGGCGLDAPGPDLVALLTGSEGLLGVVVEVVVRLLPLPTDTAVLIAGFRTVREAGDAVSDIIAQGILPAGLEMMDSLAIQAAEDFANAGYPRDAAAMLLCELDGTEEEVSALAERTEAYLKSAGAYTVSVARSAQERELVWRGRKSAFPAVSRLSPDYYCMDGTIPRSRIAEVLESISSLAKKFDLRVANVFHAGDGNLHPLILFDAKKPEQVRRAEALGAAILELSVEVGGSITGEHGVGLEKLPQMEVQFGREELLQFEELKAAFDARLLMNPGKGIPVLRRCQEYKSLPDRHNHTLNS